MFKLDLEKAEKLEINLPVSTESEKARELQSNIYYSFIDYAKAFHCVDNTKLWKILKEMGIPDHLTCLLRNLYAGQGTIVSLNMEKWTGSKLRNEFIKAIYHHPAYLTYRQSTSCGMLGWMTHNLESRLPGEISTTSDAGDTTLMAESEEKLEPLDEGERGE